MAETKDRRVIILSIYPKYVHAILQGIKRVELRKNGVPEDIDYIVFYSTSPDQAILGYAQVKTCVVAPPEQLWEEYYDVAGIEQNAFQQYFSNCSVGKCYLLENPCALLHPMTLSEIGMQMPPQSFAYVNNRIWKKVSKRKLSNSRNQDIAVDPLVLNSSSY